MANRILTIAVVGTALTLASPALAATQFTFTNGSATPTGTLPNTTTANTDVTITSVSGASAQLTGSTSPLTAGSFTVNEFTSVGVYSGSRGGLGVSNSGDTGSNQHTVDNSGKFDFVVLQFSKAVQLTGMALNIYNLDGSTVYDGDAFISYTNMNVNGLTTSQQIADVWADVFKNQKAANTTTATYNSTNYLSAANAFPSTTGLFSKTWVIGAALTPSERNDAFKIKSITVNVAPGAVPEPATWATMVLGFGLLGGALRRRGRARLAAA